MAAGSLSGSGRSTPWRFLDGHHIALSVYQEVLGSLSKFGAFEVRTTKSQVAFRLKRGIAYLWLPANIGGSAAPRSCSPTSALFAASRNTAHANRCFEFDS